MQVHHARTEDVIRRSGIGKTNFIADTDAAALLIIQTEFDRLLSAADQRERLGARFIVWIMMF